MTTEVRERIIDDITKSNDILVIAGLEFGDMVSAYTWTLPRLADIASARRQVLDLAMIRIREKFPQSNSWLFAGNRTLQPNNRITRHIGFWKSVANRGIVLPVGDFREECIEFGCEMRFSGSVKFSRESDAGIADILAAESGAIVFVDSSIDAGWMFESFKNVGGGKIDRHLPPDFLRAAVAARLIVVSVFGEFDDADVVAAVFTTPDLVASLKI